MVNVSDVQRRTLHAQLAEKIGADVADSLMDFLPPAGWSDVATRTDLDHAVQMLRLELRVMESRLETKLSDGLAKQTRWFMASQLALVIAVIGSITTIAH
jgi:hypothetical protein